MERFHSYITYTNISRFSNMNLLQHECVYVVNFTSPFVSENMSAFFA